LSKIGSGVGVFRAAAVRVDFAGVWILARPARYARSSVFAKSIICLRRSPSSPLSHSNLNECGGGPAASDMAGISLMSDFVAMASTILPLAEVELDVAPGLL